MEWRILLDDDIHLLYNPVIQPGRLTKVWIPGSYLNYWPDFAKAHANLATLLASRGDIDSAIVHYQQVLRLQPDNKLVRQNLSVMQSERERIRKMVAQQRTAVQRQPNDPALLSELAATLSSDPNASVRNGAEAVELAERASKQPGADKAEVLATLAAAYAEAGKFPEAKRTAEQAERLASAAGNPSLAEQIRSRFELFKNGKPYRQLPSR